MAIEVNGVVLSDIEPSIVIGGVEASHIVVNDVVVWTRLYIPAKPTHFVASDNLYGEVVCTWDVAGDVDWYQLIVDGSAVTPDDTNITSPYSYIFSGQGSFSIRAHNINGSIDSDIDIGISLVAGAGNVTIDYNYPPTGANPETVTGDNGAFVFTVPDGITEVTVCMVGGGGSGSIGHEGGSLYAGGGFSGHIFSGSIIVAPLSMIGVTVGVGGAPVSNTDGLAGTSSFIGTTTAVGGGGGTSGLGYNGTGASQTTCGGTSNDGTHQSDEEFGITSYGYGGQSSGFGKGGNGKNQEGGTPESGVLGAGGGAGWHYQVLSGAGGNGRLRITWG